MAKSPLGSPWDAKIDPNATPNIPVTELPDLNNSAHGARVRYALTRYCKGGKTSFLPRLMLSHGNFIVGKAPHTDGVYTASEWAPDMTDFGESGILGHYVSDLVHGCAPPKSLI